MQLSKLDHFFWAAGFLAHGVLFTTLMVRRRAARFPAFTMLIGFTVLQTPVLYVLYRSGQPNFYFNAYWTLIFTGEVLEFLVLYEIATYVFRPLGHWAPDVKRTSLVLTAASILVAAVLTALAAPSTDTWQQTLVLKATLFSAALMSELFVGMIVLSVTVGLPWRTHVARIALGLGIYSLAEILIYGAENVWGGAGNAAVFSALSQVRIGLYLLCLLYWIVALWRDAPAAQVLTPHSREQIARLQTRLGNGLSVYRSGRR